MLVFIDESGDAGFKVEKGSSPIFVTSMVIFDGQEDAAAAQERVSALRRTLRVKPEFKFSKCSAQNRDAFFSHIAGCRFRTRSVVVQKELIYSPALRTVKESFYKFFIRMMMTHDGGTLHQAKVVIDGSGDRAFRRQLRSYIRKNISRDCIAHVDLKDSARDPLIQLADMVAGAIARSYRDDRADAGRWRDQLRRGGKIEDVWEFGAS